VYTDTILTLIIINHIYVAQSLQYRQQ
jgi:hypothetical protein